MLTKNGKARTLKVVKAKNKSNATTRIESLYNQLDPEIIITDPFVVLSILEKALENLKNPLARMEAACHCIQMRKEMKWHQFREKVSGITEPLNEKIEMDPLKVLDQLEFAVLSLPRPQARLQAWLLCSIIRSDIMYREYGMDNDKY